LLHLWKKVSRTTADILAPVYELMRYYLSSKCTVKCTK